jgi:hypothetical protein
VTINPNPVPFSGQPITDAPSCASSKNTWFYDQVIRETAGTAVTIRARVDSFDSSAVNNVTNLTMVVPASGSITVRSRWCSATAVEHTAQTTFSGNDANGKALQLVGPIVRLLKP